MAVAAISPTQKKFGTASLFLDGVDDSISAPQVGDLAFASYDFTIDFWVNCGPQSNPNATILGNGVTPFDATACAIKVDAAGHVVFGSLTSTTVVTNSAWHHVALTRAGGMVRLYVDGARQASAALNTGIDFSLNGTFIGRNGWDGNSGFFTGYVDEFHSIKKIAKWTTDTSFTPPSAAYGATDVDTVLSDGPNDRGFYCFMSQATGYKMNGETVPATIAPWRCEYDKGVVDPCYAILEFSQGGIIITSLLGSARSCRWNSNYGLPAVGNQLPSIFLDEAVTEAYIVD